MFIIMLIVEATNSQPGIPNGEGRLNTVDRLIEVAGFVKNVNNMFGIKRS
jgi:hypothetical protein